MRHDDSMHGSSEGMSRVGYFMVAWILYFLIVAFMTVILMGLLGYPSVVRNLLRVCLIFACATPVFWLAKRLMVQRVGHSTEHLMLGRDAIPWSRIDGIALKRSEMGNTYLVIRYKDGTLPKSYDTFFFEGQRNSVSLLREKARQEGILFTVEEGIDIEEVVPSPTPFPTSTSFLQEMKVEYERQKKIREENLTKGEKKIREPHIKIPSWMKHPWMKPLIMVALAGAFFLGFSLVFDFRISAALFMVVLVHETGHLIAMKLFHLKTHGIFFIPFLGAGTAPEEPFPSPEIEAVVAMAGPAMGLSWNIGAYWLGEPFVITYAVQDASLVFSLILVLHIAVYLNLALNLVNLLPLLPLDGGRIVRVALLRGKKSLVLVGIVTVGGGMALSVLARDVILFIVVLLGGASLWLNYKRIMKKEVSPPAKWTCVMILGAWIGLIFLCWYTLPGPFKRLLMELLEMIGEGPFS